MEETISLKELFETLKKRLSLILSLTFLAGAISAGASYFFMTPIYQVSTDLLVNRNQVADNYNSSELNANIQFINTYSGIITSKRILDIVSEEMGGDYTTGKLQEQISVSSPNNSQILKITVEDENPENAVLIANTVADVFQNQVPDIMNVDNVSVLAEAELSENMSPVAPRPLLNIAIAIVVGLMAGVGLAFLLEYLDNTVKTEQDIQKLLDIPVLGVVTTFNTENNQAQQKSFTRLAKRGA